ncbi:hypothetical protein BpHYR1_008484 [Brachionus plicatilis]|uniref:Uncharacterized protein n=1 Tax=Brachionus plicatilis TaxID=10195 RepID=A0A3M7S8S5_BRAPC|nr:hypothetical protein BpHYR1_008484 [Brachionus plicatilis]
MTNTQTIRLNGLEKFLYIFSLKKLKFKSHKSQLNPDFDFFNDSDFYLELLENFEILMPKARRSLVLFEKFLKEPDLKKREKFLTFVSFSKLSDILIKVKFNLCSILNDWS